VRIRLPHAFRSDAGAIDAVLIILIAILILVGLIFIKVYDLG
jgi:hypothetical protein